MDNEVMLVSYKVENEYDNIKSCVLSMDGTQLYVGTANNSTIYKLNLIWMIAFYAFVLGCNMSSVEINLLFK